MTALQNVLRPPHFDQRSDNYLIALIHNVLMICITITAAGTVAAFIVAGYNVAKVIPGIVIIAGQAITLYALHRGWVRLAAWTLISITWVSVTAVAALSGGMNSYLLMCLNVVLVIAALVADQAGNRAVLAGNVIVMSAFFILERVGAGLPALMSNMSNVNWLTALSSTLATGALLSIALRNLHSSLRTAQRQRIELQQTVQELEHSTISEAYFNSIFNSMLEMILVVDENLTIIKANTPAIEALGYTEKRMVGMSLREVLGDDNPEVLLHVDGLIEDNSATFKVRTQYRTREGAIIHVDFSASRLKSERRRMVCVAHNVTEQVQTEATLKETDMRLQTAINSINVILFALDRQGDVVFSEGQGLEPLGLSSSQLIGQNIFSLYENEPDTTSDLQRALRGERFHAIARALGHTFDTYYNPMFDEEGNFTGTVGFSINITERAAAEETVIRERSLMRTLVDSLPDLIWAKDTEGRYLLSNLAHGRYHGMANTTDVIGKTLNDLMGGDVPVFNDAERVTMNSKQQLTRIEEYAAEADDRLTWWQTTYVPLLQSNELIGTVGVATDITQRKRDEETIRESEERIQAVIASASVYIFAIDRDYNLAFFEGRGVEERKIEQVGRALGQSLFVPVEGGVDIQIADEVQRAFDGEDTSTVVQLGALSFDIRFSAMRDSEQNIIGVTGIATDISEQVQIELALRESERRQSTLLNAIPDLMFVINREKEVVDYYANNNHVAGLANEEIVGSTIYDIPRSLQDLRRVEEAIDRCLDTGEMQAVEYTVYEGDTRYIYETRYARMGNNEVMALVRDMSDQRSAEEKLQRSTQELQVFTAELERSNAELQSFAYSASHDLQEPLRKIQAFGDLLVRHAGDDLDENATDYLNRMTGAASRMQQLIDGLLTFSRVTTDARVFRAIDLQQVLDEVLNDLEVSIARAGATITADAMPTVEGDLFQMRQLFQNLISNALKYTAPGNPPQIDITCRVINQGSADYVRITFTDNGIGFDSKHRDRIFGVFQRLHTRNQYAGTGMGLAICKRIVERHSGEITAVGRKGQGASFIVTLPVKQFTQPGGTDAAQ
ncbi:MAG: PAS domain-containing protein [Chloroflexota bacterium]